MDLSQVTSSDLMSFGKLTVVECTIDVMHLGNTYPVVLSQRSDYANTFDTSLWNWAMKGTPGADYNDAQKVFKLIYHSQTPNRLNYRFCGTSDNNGKRLACSHKGYVGMYAAADATKFFKIEPLAWDGTKLQCRWRNHLGEIVKVGDRDADPKYGGTKGGLIDHLNVQIPGDCMFFITPIR